MRKLNNWTKAIVNHFHHCIHNTPLESDLRTEMWRSLLRHVTDDHEHPSNRHYLRCEHEPIVPKTVDGKAYVADWLLKGMYAYVLRVYLYIYMYVCIACIYVYVVYMCCMYACIHTHTYIHTYTCNVYDAYLFLCLYRYIIITYMHMHTYILYNR